MTSRQTLVRAATVAVIAASALVARPAVAAEQKLGYFDVKRILAEVDDAKAAKNKLQKEFEEKQRQLDEEKTSLEKLQKEYEQKSPVLSNAAKEQLQMELAGKMQKAQKLYVELQQDLAGKEQAALGDLLGRLEPVVREVAETEGYTFIFEKNEAGLFFAPMQHDLTAQVIRRYNTKFAKAAPIKKTK